MAGLLDLLNSDIGRQLVRGASAKSGASESKTVDVLSMALPVLMGAMKKNVQTEQGASGLMGALNGRHRGGILENLGDLMGNGGPSNDVMSDGAGILEHLLGGRRNNVENALSQKSGLDANTIAQILKVAAPILMGVIGKQTTSSGINDKNAMNTFLGSMLGGQPKENQSLITTLLDSDGDGSILDDVAGMVLGSNKNSGGLLGGLFGK